MRVWLVDDKIGDRPGNLEVLLQQLEQRPGTGLRLVGSAPFQPDFPASLRKLVPDLVDLLVVNERAWPEGPWLEEILSLGIGLVMVTAADRFERFRPLASLFPISFAVPSAGLDELWLALATALADLGRETQWKSQVARLQQRLNDRIVIERAKGILVQRLRISEEEAYKRLRMLSRRQRRQIRDIAQSLLDAEFLFAPGSNGFGEVLAE